MALVAEGYGIARGVELDAPVELTLDTNGNIVLTANKHHFTLDTFEDAASDSLGTVSGIVANREYTFRAAHADRSVVIPTASTIKVAVEFTMNNVNDILRCVGDPTGAFLIPISVQNNGA